LDGGALGALDFARRWQNLLGGIEPHTDAFDPIAAKDIEPVGPLGRLAGKRDPRLELLLVPEGEVAGRFLAGAVAAVVGGAGFVAVGCDRDPPGGRPGLERADPRGRDRGGDRELSRLDLGPVHERKGRGGFDALGEHQVPRYRWIGPHSTAQPAALWRSLSLADFFGSCARPSDRVPSSALPCPLGAT
jgi:hypothetical protein